MLTQADMGARAGKHPDPVRDQYGRRGMVALMVTTTMNLPAQDATIFTGVGAGVGVFLPYAYASYRRTKRFQRFEELFPEAIDTLARAVRAGHAFHHRDRTDHE